LIGQIISHYRVVEKLGGGGMGVVYKAEDTRLDRFVGSEVPTRRCGPRPPKLWSVSGVRLKAASALNHPKHLHHPRDGKHQGKSFIVMECLDE